MDSNTISIDAAEDEPGSAVEQAALIAGMDAVAPKARSYLPVYLLCALAVIGVVGGFIAATRFGAGAWQNVEGTVTQFDVSRLSSYSPAGGAVDTIRISYSYEVDGAIYVGTRVGCDGSNDLNWTSAADANRQYAIDDAIRVYYKQADPAISCLEYRLVSERAMRTMAVVLAALAAAVVLLKLGRALSV